MEVVKQTYRKFGIKLDGLNVPESIIEAISGGKGRVELTYLQVLWTVSTNWPPKRIGRSSLQRAIGQPAG